MASSLDDLPAELKVMVFNNLATPSDIRNLASTNKVMSDCFKANSRFIIGALIPLAVPFLLRGEVSAVGLITALAISSSVVDCSPFSTNGALVVANSDASERDMVFRQLMIWGMSMIVIAPLVTWAILILPTT